MESSKVTVEYHDPSGVFPLLSSQLTSRLPLRNLHWKSPSRPLRSIDSLHVDLVPSTDSADVSANASQPDQVTDEGALRPNSEHGQPGAAKPPSSSEISRGTTKERRHQIPGLRRTPYLKVFLLRCDDSETYKASSRKILREWVRTHTPPSQSSSSASTQENHDAFEWLILHVVLPDTPAASQPRGSGAAGVNSGTTEKSSSSRWTRGSTTIFEKIRADFNLSSKSAPDRVAQVRLQKDVVPPHMLPSGSAVVGSPYSESPQELNNAWIDVISKFKTLILLSFDLRVSQYEEDIREKDSQRALPGWNFCTFFILKEGLARGFESVGLVEDALVGYDELSFGLDSIIRDQASDNSQGGTFLQYTEDLQQHATIIQNEPEKQEHSIESHSFRHVFGDKPLNALKKNYRESILSSNISVFDFRCYIFSRQLLLLLRLGNAQSARTELAAKLHMRPSASVAQRSVDDLNVGTKPGINPEMTEDLLSLSELCLRSLSFITSAARVLKDDLNAGSEILSNKLPSRLIDNLVSSWTFAAAQQILDDTTTSSLPVSKFRNDAASGSSGKMRSFGAHAEEMKANVPEPKTMIHPARSSSLTHRRTSTIEPPYSQIPPSGQVVFDHGRFEDRPPPISQASALPMKSGVQDLAGNRAKLYVVQRRVLEHIGKTCGWAIGWAAFAAPRSSQKDDFRNVDLDETNEQTDWQPQSEQRNAELSSPTLGLCEATLFEALSSLGEFRGFYERLSDLVVKHYMAAGQSNSAESILGDLAALKFELGDYAAAAMYFSRMAPQFAETRWNFVETAMLKMYAQCLKKLNRKDEYTRTLLDLLAKSAAKKKSIRVSRKSFRPTYVSNQDINGNTFSWLDDDNAETDGLFNELLAYSEQLPYDITVPMSKYFGDIVVEPYVRHYEDRDGFQLRLQVRHFLEDDILIERARIHLIHVTPEQGKELWLDLEDTMLVKKGLFRTWLDSNINTSGSFVVDKIIIQAKKIIFIHEPIAKPDTTTPLGISTPSMTALKIPKKARILCFPRMESFQAKIALSNFIHIDRPRSIEIRISSGWNDIQTAEIRIRSASAGLRLRTANAEIVSGKLLMTDKSKPGIIDIADMPANSNATIQIPYEVENILPELSIRLELDYLTEKGQFQLIDSSVIPVELPLDVNVHDHFKGDALFSRFNIKTASSTPLEVLDVSLDGSEVFEVQPPRKVMTPIFVFPKQPVSVTYKITTKGASEATSARNSRGKLEGPTLGLTVKYRCLDEAVLARAEELFTAAIQSSPLHRLGRLLVPAFIDRLEHKILPGQFEKIALLDKIELGSFEDLAWSEHIDSLPSALHDDTLSWLKKWHDRHPSITLDIASDSGLGPFRTSRTIVITVAIPQTHVVHTASLQIFHPEHRGPQSTIIAAVGKMLIAELRIKHTRRWTGSPESFKTAAHISNKDDPIDFVYDLEANPDVWLVAGHRRSHFAAREDELLTFPIMLLPLRPGNFLLPTVDIRHKVTPSSLQQGRADSAAPGPEENLSCETDYLSHGEAIVVIPDLQSTTVGMNRLGPGASTVLMESEARSGGGMIV